MTSLYRFEMLSDVYVDACLRDASGKLLFMSVFGRDTSIQQMFASFSLPIANGGLDTFHLRGADNRRHQVYVGDPDQLTKHTGRLPRENLFGNLLHCWVFDETVKSVDFANRTAWLLERSTALTTALANNRVWDIYKLLSPVPLLDHWRDSLLDATRDSVTAFDKSATYPPLGDIVAYRIQLSDSFTNVVSDMVKNHLLTLNESESTVMPIELLAA